MTRKKFYRPLKSTCIKFCLFNSILLFSYTRLFCQENKFILGFNIGFNSTQVSGDDLAGFDQFGGYGGLSISRKINEDSFWQFQIAFSQKGSRKPSDPNGNNSIYVIRLNYIDVPIIYTTPIAKKWFNNILLELGVVNSYLINYTERNTLGNVFPVRPFDKYELSGMMGMGYEMKKNIHFTLRYYNSILPIRNHQSNATYLWNRGQYNSVAQLSFTYFLGAKND